MRPTLRRVARTRPSSAIGPSESFRKNKRKKGLHPECRFPDFFRAPVDKARTLQHARTVSRTPQPTECRPVSSSPRPNVTSAYRTPIPSRPISTGALRQGIMPQAIVGQQLLQLLPMYRKHSGRPRPAARRLRISDSRTFRRTSAINPRRPPAVSPSRQLSQGIMLQAMIGQQ